MTSTILYAKQGAVAGSGPRQRRFERLRGMVRTSQLLMEMPKVRLAAIDGGCAGAGLS
jgi:2-(1,2-epoxy-1,2-dihydrophenyl)acetyl-CoA isomerase